MKLHRSSALDWRIRIRSLLVECAALMAMIAGAAYFSLLHAQSSGSIQGVVSDDSGKLLTGAYIIASPTKPGQTLMAVSGSDGTYKIAQAAPGSYNVCAEYRNNYWQSVGPFTTSPVRYVDSCGWSDPATVTVAAGQTIANINFRAVKGAVLHVRLNDAGKAHGQKRGGRVGRRHWTL